MRITYDQNADAAYIYIVDEISAGSVKKTVLVDPAEVCGMINLDFDSQGHLLGVEVLDASMYLPAALLGDTQ